MTIERPCTYCVAGYGLNAEDCGWAHEHDVAPLAHMLAGAINETDEPTDEQVGWYMEDAEAIWTDFNRTPKKWTVTEFRTLPSSEFVAQFKVNGVHYVIEDGEGYNAPVRLSTWRQWQREAADV